MKKTHFITIALLLTSLLLLSPFALAQDNTDSDEPDETIKENIKKRLEKVAGETDENQDESGDQKRGLIGTVTDINGQTITLEQNDTNRQIEVTDDTTVINEDREKIKLENLEINSFVIAMGYLQATGVLEGKRIVVTQKPKALSHKAYQVKVTEIEDETLTVESTTDDQSWQVTPGKNTSITHTVDGNQSELEPADIKVNDKLIIIAEIDPDTPTVLDATSIHLSNGRQIMAEPSASPEAEKNTSNEEE